MSTEKIDEIKVEKEFINENIKSFNKKFHKKGGPYNKKDRDARRTEAYRLHFEYGYSAIKIAELMSVNRNTINGDIDYWYSKILNTNRLEPEFHILINLKRLETQRTRLREDLDKTATIQEKITLERLIYEMDSKILQIFFKLAQSEYRVHKIGTNWVNKALKKNKIDYRYLTFFDIISVSEKAEQRIRQIINEDRRKTNH